MKPGWTQTQAIFAKGSPEYHRPNVLFKIIIYEWEKDVEVNDTRLRETSN